VRKTEHVAVDRLEAGLAATGGPELGEARACETTRAKPQDRRLMAARSRLLLEHHGLDAAVASTQNDPPRYDLLHGGVDQRLLAVLLYQQIEEEIEQRSRSLARS